MKTIIPKILKKLKKITRRFNKIFPNILEKYFEFNVQPTTIKGFRFFGINEIQEKITELIINNTWNNHFIPLGNITSLQ